MNKTCTNIKQSKKLTEILPLSSADMFWYRDAVTTEANPRIMNYMQIPELQSMYYSPCWSLAALLRELPDTMLGKDKDGYVVMVETMGSGLTTFASNPIDACYEMIVKLHEQKNE